MASINQRNTIGNQDLLRIILWFCGEKIAGTDYIRKFDYATKLQKLAFLAQNEFTEDFKKLIDNSIYLDKPFAFTADNFGPFSVDLLKLTKKLKREEEIKMTKDGKTSYLISSKMREKLAEIKSLIETNNDLRDWIKKIVEINTLSLHQILSHVYRNPNYQDYLINSAIKDRYAEL